jgi:outer membrane protein assembly factor BamB
LQPLDAGPPEEMKSTVDAVNVPEPVQTSSMGTLRVKSPGKILYLPTDQVQFAATDQILAAASPNRVYIVDWDLQVPRVLDGAFEPVTMSLDEAGRIYLAVKRKGKPDELWLFTQEGTLVYTFEFPAGTPALTAPPIVAYDHRVYLTAGSQILALGADGRLDWSRSAAAPVAAVALPDGRLLTAEGEWIAVWDAAGKRTALFQAPGEGFETAPVPTASGDILAATGAHLYCLGVRQARWP